MVGLIDVAGSGPIFVRCFWSVGGVVVAIVIHLRLSSSLISGSWLS
jgi:hypothetical protein